MANDKEQFILDTIEYYRKEDSLKQIYGSDLDKAKSVLGSTSVGVSSDQKDNVQALVDFLNARERRLESLKNTTRNPNISYDELAKHDDIILREAFKTDSAHRSTPSNYDKAGGVAKDVAGTAGTILNSIAFDVPAKAVAVGKALASDEEGSFVDRYSKSEREVYKTLEENTPYPLLTAGATILADLYTGKALIKGVGKLAAKGGKAVYGVATKSEALKHAAATLSVAISPTAQAALQKAKYIDDFFNTKKVKQGIVGKTFESTKYLTKQLVARGVETGAISAITGEIGDRDKIYNNAINGAAIGVVLGVTPKAYKEIRGGMFNIFGGSKPHPGTLGDLAKEQSTNKSFIRTITGEQPGYAVNIDAPMSTEKVAQTVRQFSKQSTDPKSAEDLISMLRGLPEDIPVDYAIRVIAGGAGSIEKSKLPISLTEANMGAVAAAKSAVANMDFFRGTEGSPVAQRKILDSATDAFTQMVDSTRGVTNKAATFASSAMKDVGDTMKLAYNNIVKSKLSNVMSSEDALTTRIDIVGGVLDELEKADLRDIDRTQLKTALMDLGDLLGRQKKFTGEIATSTVSGTSSGVGRKAGVSSSEAPRIKYSERPSDIDNIFEDISIDRSARDIVKEAKKRVTQQTAPTRKEGDATILREIGLSEYPNQSSNVSSIVTSAGRGKVINKQISKEVGTGYQIDPKVGEPVSLAEVSSIVDSLQSTLGNKHKIAFDGVYERTKELVQRNFGDTALKDFQDVRDVYANLVGTVIEHPLNKPAAGVTRPHPGVTIGDPGYAPSTTSKYAKFGGEGDFEGVIKKEGLAKFKQGLRNIAKNVVQMSNLAEGDPQTQERLSLQLKNLTELEALAERKFLGKVVDSSDLSKTNEDVIDFVKNTSQDDINALSDPKLIEHLTNIKMRIPSFTPQDIPAGADTFEKSVQIKSLQETSQNIIQRAFGSVAMPGAEHTMYLANQAQAMSPVASYINREVPRAVSEVGSSGIDPNTEAILRALAGENRGVDPSRFVERPPSSDLPTSVVKAIPSATESDQPTVFTNNYGWKKENGQYVFYIKDQNGNWIRTSINQ